MILIVDQNEKDTNPKIVKMLEKYFSKVIIANLPHHEYGGISVTSGDINIPLSNGGVLAIERKTPDDFLSSIASRHIFNQVEVMAQHAKFSVVIVTGGFIYGEKDDMVYIKTRADGSIESKDDLVKTNWKGSSVRNAITAIMYSGCPVIFCPPHKFCDMIAEQYAQANQPTEHQSIVKKRVITFPPIDARVEALANIFPGVSLVLAESLLNFAGMMKKVEPDILGNTYGSVADALHWLTVLSTIDKSSRPKGWGPNKILSARKFLGLESNEFIACVKEIETGKIVDGYELIEYEMEDKRFSLKEKNK